MVHTTVSAHRRAKVQLWRNVRRGALRLNEHSPRWRDAITRPLQMTVNTHCVVGQTVGRYSSHPYTYGLARLGLTTMDAANHGFSVVSVHDGWGELQGAWRRVIRGAVTVR